MASSVNRHCVERVDTLSLPINSLPCATYNTETVCSECTTLMQIQITFKTAKHCKSRLYITNFLNTI